MDLIKVYQCLCDATRLRILNLLLEGPLCVCHLVEILDLEQPKVSRHLQALKAAGAVTTQRCYNWTIYRLAEAPNALLEANLKCLQDVRAEERRFRDDLKRRARVIAGIESASGGDLPEAIRCSVFHHP
jgi:ArsR family transcriptional regulator